MENYNEIENLGKLQFSLEEVSRIVGEDITRDIKAVRAYEKGKLLAIAEVRSAMLQLAKSGDSSAIKTFHDLSNQEELKSVEL